MGHIQKVQVNEHQLPITGQAESFKHQIHPDGFARPVDFLAYVPSDACEFQGAQIFEWYECGGAWLAVGCAILKEIEIVAPLLVHEAQQTFEHDSAFHDAGPGKDGLDIFFECGVENRGGSLYHSADVVCFLAGIGVPIEHAELYKLPPLSST